VRVKLGLWQRLLGLLLNDLSMPDNIITDYLFGRVKEEAELSAFIHPLRPL
jgi:hypothetical protein